mmetsp:Transcript_19799/g.34094  ORF Transcript_19799/g.34094 Transcript_19799/m.34094 type:complete len:236 (+) Transcript_19799:43-750(+)
MFRHHHPARHIVVIRIALYWLLTICIGRKNARVDAFEARPLYRFPSFGEKKSLPHHRPQRKSIVSNSRPLFSNEGGNENEEYDPRDNFGRSIRGFQSSALKTTVDVGDLVVCKRSLPNLGIYENASYEVTSIYTQSFNEETQKIVKQPWGSLEKAASVGNTNPNNVVYMTLFLPEQGEAVVVTPEEVGLVTVREELGNAVWLAVPGFFWVFVAANFYNTYHERTGGSFGDAFWGR